MLHPSFSAYNMIFFCCFICFFYFKFILLLGNYNLYLCVENQYLRCLMKKLRISF